MNLLRLELQSGILGGFSQELRFVIGTECVCIHRLCMRVHIFNLVLQGLRAFLPKAELLNRVNNFTELKQNVSQNS